MPDILAASGEVINLVPRHGIAERVFEVYPREIRELQIVFEYLFKGFVLEHHGLRQGNIRQHGRFLFAHCAANHKHDRAGVDEPAIFHLIVIEDDIADFPAPTVDKKQCKQYPTPNGNKGYCRPQIENEFINLSINVCEIERHDEIQIKGDELQNDCEHVEVKEPQRKPYLPINTAFAEKADKGKNPLLYGEIERRSTFEHP